MSAISELFLAIESRLSSIKLTYQLLRQLCTDLDWSSFCSHQGFHQAWLHDSCCGQTPKQFSVLLPLGTWLLQSLKSLWGGISSFATSSVPLLLWYCVSGSLVWIHSSKMSTTIQLQPKPVNLVPSQPCPLYLTCLFLAQYLYLLHITCQCQPGWERVSGVDAKARA